MKRFITALLTGALVFGAVLGAAASLGITGNVLQYGADDDLTCTDDVFVAYAAESGGTVASAKIFGLDSCVGEKVIARWNSNNSLRATFDVGDTGSNIMAIGQGGNPQINGTLAPTAGPGNCGPAGTTPDPCVTITFPSGTSSEALDHFEMTVHTGTTNDLNP